MSSHFSPDLFKNSRASISGAIDSAIAGTFSGHPQPAGVAGKVWLVGAGPGDAELLTLKAMKAISNADIIFYDQLVSEDVRLLFPKSVPAIYVGKQKNQHSIAQQELNKLLVMHAQSGKQVCRVKGGDPFIFGRGSEELLELRKAGIAAEVIPGITAASGCSTYADIPLTHRGVAQGCTFVTAHTEKSPNIDWHALAQLDHTLVFYMGVSRAQMIASELMAAGQAADTPVAVIENGSRVNQRVVVAELKNLAQTVAEKNIQSPALIVIGQVVNLADQLKPNTLVAAAAEKNTQLNTCSQRAIA